MAACAMGVCTMDACAMGVCTMGACAMRMCTMDACAMGGHRQSLTNWKFALPSDIRAAKTLWSNSFLFRVVTQVWALCNQHYKGTAVGLLGVIRDNDDENTLSVYKITTLYFTHCFRMCSFCLERWMAVRPFVRHKQLPRPSLVSCVSWHYFLMCLI